LFFGAHCFGKRRIGVDRRWPHFEVKLGWRLCRVNLGLLDVALGREYFSTRAHWLRPALQEELARIWFFRASAAFFPDLFEINHVQAAIFSPKI
jgi:hypothetical protein